MDADGAESALRVARANADTIGASAKAEAGRPAEPMAIAAIGTTSGGDDGGSEGGDGDGENEEAEENEDGDADSNDYTVEYGVSYGYSNCNSYIYSN